MWLEHAREGRVESGTGEGELLVRLGDGELVRATPSPTVRERGFTLITGDAVLLRPRGGDFEMVIACRFEEGREVPLTLPSVDPSVEYLFDPADPKWLHPYLPYLYDWYDDFVEDLPMWRRLAKEAGGPILELACGTGRIVGELAREGHRVTGVDLSAAMLARAAEKLSGAPVEVHDRVEWACADMSSWESDCRFPLACIACNSLHYLGSTDGRAPEELRRESIGTLFRHVAPGGLGVISNVAPFERISPPERYPSPRLLLSRADVNPNTGLFTAEYFGLHQDVETGRCYDGPWRFQERRPDGTLRRFEFAPPPTRPGEIPLPEWIPPLTREETLALMREAGFVDIRMRSAPELGPVSDQDRVVVFLGRRPTRR